MRATWLAGVVAGVLGGCQALGLACTDVGCQGTLTVLLDRTPTEDAVITVDVGVERMECGVATATMEPPCVIEDGADGPSLVLRVGMGTAPETVEVEVSEGGAAAVSHTVTVAWGEPFYPNGMACDGEDGGCRSGEGSLSLD